MPAIEKEIPELDSVKVFDFDVETFLDACDNEELDQVFDYLDDKGFIEREVEVIEEEVGFKFPYDGSNSDRELNSTLEKLSDARLQLTNEDLGELKRIAGKYR